jgi:hypothetical protein
MHTYLYGWRRKAGVATLLTACALAILWARSYVAASTIDIYAIDRLFELRSANGLIRWSELADVGGQSFTLWTIHYGLLAAPLTLLSAYLILWKPRKRA